MAYFPHNREDEYENPRLNRFEDNYPTSKSRNYSPDDKDKITQRIIKYFEDPKEAKALAEIKKLSNKAKKSSKDVRSNLGDFIGNDNLKNNTELNRVMFKDEGGDYQLEQPNARNSFQRRKFKFSTQRYVPKNKNMSLIDEIRNKQNENEENAGYKRKKDNRIIRFSIDNGIENENLEVNNKNKNYGSNTSKPVSNHSSNFRRYKKLKSENIARPRFRERKQEIKPKNDDDSKKIEIVEGSYETIPEEYKAKNNATVENLDNKEQIVINEYHTKNRNAPKNYKTEYVWDKSINRLVEKRIYLDKNELNDNNNNNNEERKYNSNSVNYRNRYKRLDDKNDDNRIKKDNKYENDEKEEKEDNKRDNLKTNIRRKYKNYAPNDNEDKNKDENEDKKIEVRKRFGNSTVILKKEIKTKNKNDEKDNDINPNQNYGNRGNRFYKKYRNDKPENKEEEKPKQEEIIIEKTTVIEKVEEPKYETPEKRSSSVKTRRIYKKRLNNLILNDDKVETEKSNDKNITEANPKREHKYNKRPYIQPIELVSDTIYTKKKILEEIPKKEAPIEKKYEKKIEKYEEKKLFEEEEKEKYEPKKKFEKKAPKVNAYNKYKKKNMRIKTVLNDSDDEIEDKRPKINNTVYSNYTRNKRKASDKRAQTARTTSELIDDLEKIENYNVNTYLKDDLLEIYDNLHEQCNDFKNDIFYTNINSFEFNMGEFDKYKIPFSKKKTKAEDLCRGRVTSEDIYRKYSQNARKYEKKRLYE